MSVRSKYLFALSMAVIASAVAPTRSDALPKLIRTGPVTAIAASRSGGVYLQSDDEGILYASRDVRPRALKMNRRKIPAEIIEAFGRGGDGRIWIAVRDPEKGKAHILIADRGRIVRQLTLPSDADVSAIAAGPNGSTWLAGFTARRVGVFDRKMHLRRVELRHSWDYDAVVSGGGYMWAAGDDSIARISRRGAVRKFKLPTRVWRSMVYSGGAIWLCGARGLIRVAGDGSAALVPLKYPDHDEGSTDHVNVLPGRDPYSLLATADGGVRFEAGATALSSGGDSMLSLSSGTVSREGVVTETLDDRAAGLGFWDMKGLPLQLLARDRLGEVWSVDHYGRGVVVEPAGLLRR